MVGSSCANHIAKTSRRRVGLGSAALPLLKRTHTDLELDYNRYKVAVVSNQGGISLKPDPKKAKSDLKRLADFKGKVSAVFRQLELPISVYAATRHDWYRKPRIGMWKELLEDCNLEAADAVDLEESFFVGDAGGREAMPGGPSKDHSCVDR
jgi:bifunctional polynucleotide phosphatase/kinase